MVDYELDYRQSFFYSEYDDSIGIGMTKNLYDKLTKRNKLLDYIADSLTHEHLHKWINDNIGNTESCLFDTIGHFFRDDKLFEKTFGQQKGFESWKSFINREGFNAFTKHYRLSYADLVRAGVRKE